MTLPVMTMTGLNGLTGDVATKHEDETMYLDIRECVVRGYPSFDERSLLLQ